MQTIRCSALPRIMSCPASVEKPDIIINQGSDAARLGTAAHEFYAKIVTENIDTVEPDLIWHLSSKHNVDTDELKGLCWNGLRLWGQIRDKIRYYDAESRGECVIRNTFVLGGTPDVAASISDKNTNFVVIDWKTGRKEYDPLPQLKGYSLIEWMAQGSPALESFKLVTVWTRLNIIETVEVTADDLLAFEGELMDIVTAKERKYNPNDSNCVFCPLQHDCPARLRYLQASGEDIRAIVGDSGGEVTPFRLAALYPQSRMLKKSLDKYEKMLKQVVADAGGNLGNLSFKEEQRQEVTYDAEIIAEVLGEVEQKHKISKTDLKQMVDKVAPQRGKGKMLKELIDILESRGMIETKTIKKLEWRE